MSQSEDAKELAEEFSTPARELTSVMGGAKILEPLLYSDKSYFHQFQELKLQSRIRSLLKQAIDAQKDVDVGGLIDQACQDLNIKRDWADKYFKSSRYQRWYADRMKEIEDHSGLSIEYLASKHKDNLEGRINLTSSQLDSAKELGDRIWPKISRIEHEISKKEAITLDDMPDYQKKVDELQNQLRRELEKENQSSIMEGKTVDPGGI